jgi:Fe-S-cluster containining protein
VVAFDKANTVTRYTGVACTLLGADGKCTVYPVRPVACRTHHNLAPDESNCIIAGFDRSQPLPTTPSINLNEFLAQHALVFYQRQYADIREWFP